MFSQKTVTRSSKSNFGAFLVGGMAALINITLHVRSLEVWQIVGVFPIVLIAMGFTGIGLTVRYAVQRRKSSLAALIVSVILMLYGVMLAGQHLFRDQWFGQYLN
jgi:uncharacterized membrane protein YhaH (DUF805 family)